MKFSNLKKFWPSTSQWQKWTLPSKLTFIGCSIGFIALIIAIISLVFVVWPPSRQTTDFSRNEKSMKNDSSLKQENMRLNDYSSNDRLRLHFSPKYFARNMELRFGNDSDFQKLCNAPQDQIFTIFIFDFPLNHFPYLKKVTEGPNDQTVEIFPRIPGKDPFNINGYYRISHSIIKNPDQDALYTALFKNITVSKLKYEEYRKISYPLLRVHIAARKRIMEKVIKKTDNWMYDRTLMEGSDFQLKTKKFFLEVFNTFLREALKIESPVKYDDISSYFVEYRKGDYPLYLCLYFLTAKKDYLILFDIYFTKEVRRKVQKSTNKFREGFGKIDSEEKLYEVVLFAISQVKHETDNRRLYNPFWNKTNGKHFPKREPDIQPTLTTFLRFILEREFGVDISSNVNEGIGDIDYKFSYSFEHKKYNVVAELKLADHKNLWHGLESQLPAYMRSTRTTHGIFWVLWHKTLGVYEFPKKYDSIAELDIEIMTRIANTTDKTELRIKGITCDVSIRPSASVL